MNESRTRSLSPPLAGRLDARAREALLPVHAVTVTGASDHAWRTSSDDRTRRLMVLQAAAWLADLHAWLKDNDCIADATKPSVALGAEAEEAPATMEALVAFAKVGAFDAPQIPEQSVAPIVRPALATNSEPLTA